MNNTFSCFKAYDIRGKVPDELNAELCSALGRALAQIYHPAKVVVGQDARLSSPVLVQAIVDSLLAYGTNITTLGLCGTEELYHASATGNFDLGIMITGSHNPLNENGIKLVARGALPISSDSGLATIARYTAKLLHQPAAAAESPGTIEKKSLRDAYIDWLLSYAGFDAMPDTAQNPPLRILADAGNGCAGPALSAISGRIPAEIILMNAEPDGNFPGGIPNPLLPEKRHATARAVLENHADLGVAFDGDFDRCFFYDHTGRFVDSCYLAGLLAAEILHAHPGEKVVHDIRAYWNTHKLVVQHGGLPVKAKAGHSFMKERMRAENAIFGAELSGHYFYRDFYYCDSGMLTMLLMLSLLMRTGKHLSDLVEAGINEYPCSGEINFKVGDAVSKIAAVWEKYINEAIYSDRLDGINIEFSDWRFNLRASNTEPLLRLNIESRGMPELLSEKLAELTDFIKS